MSEQSGAYKNLKRLLDEKKLEIRFKKGFKNEFGVWLYKFCKTNPSPNNLFGYLYPVYWIFSSEWVWIPLSFALAYFVNWSMLLLFAVPWISSVVLTPVGKKKLISESLEDEMVFDELWKNGAFGLLSTETIISPGTGKPRPKVIISPPQDWREEIYFLD